MENNVKTQAEIEKEMLELNEQFSEFLLTKGELYRAVLEGIVMRYRLCF